MRSLNQEAAMCNLYNVTPTREAIVQITRALSDRTGFNEPSRNIYPGDVAPIVRVGVDGQRGVAPPPAACPLRLRS